MTVVLLKIRSTMTIGDFRERLTDEILNSQSSHNSDREHDLLERIAFVSMELRLLIGR